ncbi:VOC family protein [Fulvivirga ligni]|uniref:VOC family protein n=1 Tax=Fulvivirga ligni TaxID=2904246 RepID=UPI001F34CCB1|nr:VOC family protein [Fulvivirga ligni]UII19177.1 VOC family protein [Fulvivirga ligni]
MATLNKISTCLWFNGNATEAAGFYTSIFKDSSIEKISHYSKGFEESGWKEGDVLSVDFYLLGYHFVAINSNPNIPFNKAVSFMINCDNQEEIDYYWTRLSESSDPVTHQCGWLVDKFGVTWQVNYKDMSDFLSHSDPARAQAALLALSKMKKLDIEALKEASLHV